MRDMQAATVLQAADMKERKVLPHRNEDPVEGEDEEQFKVVWAKSLTADIRRLAEVTDRSIKNASEMLMRWAVDQAKREWGLPDDAGGEEAATTGKKRKD